MTDRPKRSTVELLILMLGATVCGCVLLVAIGIAVIEVIHPQTDTSAGITLLTTVVSALVGGVLGLIAGWVHRGRRARPDRE